MTRIAIIIWCFVLTGNAQVLVDHYRFGAAVGNDLLDGLAAFYKFDEASGNATDSSGNARHLTQNGTIATNVGKIIGSRKLDGTTSSDYFSHASAAWNTFGTNELNVMLWVKGDPAEAAVSDNNVLLSKWDVNGTTNASWMWQITRFDNGDGTYEHTLTLNYSTDGTHAGFTEIANLSLGQMDANLWYFLGFRRVGNDWTLFYAPESASTVTFSSPATAAITLFDNGATPLVVGDILIAGLPFFGDTDLFFDEMRIGDGPLSDCSIYKYFRAGSGLPFGDFNSDPCL